MAKLQKTDTSSILSHWYGYNMKIVFQSILIGLFAGFIVVAYRLSINKADMLREQAYAFLKNSSWLLILGWFILLVAVGFILSVIIKRAPMSKGSGIPQIKGVLLRQVQLSWLKDILAKFFGGLLALGFGLSLGREGPSVQLGASTGLGFSKVTKRPSLEEKYLITAGASAGLAAAFNSPLAGVMFALEELHRHFSPLLLMSAMAASITADVV
jgi:H+/Cl- antiporter ClcA